MYLLSVLVFTYVVIIYRCINAPGKGRIKIYGINGYDNIYLRQKIFMVGTEEHNN